MKELGNLVMIVGLGFTGSRLFLMDKWAGIGFWAFALGFIIWKSFN